MCDDIDAHLREEVVHLLDGRGELREHRERGRGEGGGQEGGGKHWTEIQ
jgi:hypothetical protein